MQFDKSKCITSKIYCGDKNALPPNTATQKYSRKGTPHECLKKGFGMGMWTEKKKLLPATSLQHITYVGDVFEEHFKNEGMNTQAQLLQKFRALTRANKRNLLLRCCRKRNNVVDYRVYNSVLLFLHEHNVNDLPLCTDIIE